MSSSASKVQTKTRTAYVQNNEPKTSESRANQPVQPSGNRLSIKLDTSTKMNNLHESLKSIQHEYEQFEINMDEKD